ncbi:hypothetical protein FC26_GL002279 [Paucilactobacillus vaccinostercus DSM 20634]|uniref:HipA-like kinase domain-containing protein n=1 Tax=Paucilactobacillus vaccinostercus DSM 20634 TaxID=1423813 RepID=A0A0R2ABU0_9LACO|nr:HipA family kinase [Paucilactobacillus vaccinostercus]KRM61062.1 hypothetical protein FC26_GL002279 [Paucilactobacillus vaccinostercus DSM 20634]
MVKVNAIINQMNAGRTHPFLVSCDDSKQYIMKCINNTTNGKALFNEIFASRLAKLLCIQTPYTNIAKLPENIVEANSLLTNNESHPGKCFISEMISGTALGINQISAHKILNDEIFPEIIFFDTLVMNSDRADNKGNWFVKKSTRNLIALDHTNIFRIAQIWDNISLEQDSQNPPEIIKDLDDIAYALLADEYKRRNPETNHPFSPIKRRLSELSEDEINSCFSNIPDEWAISDTDLEAAKKFLHFQIAHSDDIVYKLEQKFGFNKGGYLHG